MPFHRELIPGLILAGSLPVASLSVLDSIQRRLARDISARSAAKMPDAMKVASCSDLCAYVFAST